MPLFHVTGSIRTYRARTRFRNLFFTTVSLSVLPEKTAPLSTSVHVVALLLAETVKDLTQKSPLLYPCVATPATVLTSPVSISSHSFKSLPPAIHTEAASSSGSSQPETTEENENDDLL